jgi:predicted GIY-YIG superfamily endonuclease
MPKKNVDYSKTIIYKIVCNDLTIKDVYVGYTTDFTKRKWGHKTACNNVNNKSHNQKVYTKIRDENGWNNWSMIEIEKYICNNSNEARTRERYWYEQLNANLNSVNPIRSVKEYYETNIEDIKQYKKEYRISNIDKIKLQDKVYRESHKDDTVKYSMKYREINNDKIRENKNKICMCYCGTTFTNANKGQHLKSNKHINLCKILNNNK